MCLFVHDNNPIPLVAERDIEVKKVLVSVFKTVENHWRIGWKQQYETPFTNTPVVFVDGKSVMEAKYLTGNVTYFGDSNPVKNVNFSLLTESDRERIRPETIQWVDVFQGIHAYIDRETVLRESSWFSSTVRENYQIFDAVIPKGTKYFLGTVGDVVSEKLIVFYNRDSL